MTQTKTWTPEGFAQWQRYFPATAFVPPPAHLDWTERFIESWQAPDLRLPKNTLVVLVGGLYSEFLPRCFHACSQALGQQGYAVLRMPVRSSRGVIAQGRHIAQALRARLEPGQRFVVLAHSKGGLDTLAALRQAPALLDACDGLALVQPPVGPSAIADQLLGARPKVPHSGQRFDGLLRALVGCRWLAAGTRDISRQRDPQVAALLDDWPQALHGLHVVSWSAQQRSRLDAHHERLNTLRPGHAHDGQFYLQDQLLPGLPQICLPHLDHGQPLLGGAGFVRVRFWLTLLEVLHQGGSAPGIHTR